MNIEQEIAHKRKMFEQLQKELAELEEVQADPVKYLQQQVDELNKEVERLKNRPVTVIHPERSEFPPNVLPWEKLRNIYTM